MDALATWFAPILSMVVSGAAMLLLNAAAARLKTVTGYAIDAQTVAQLDNWVTSLVGQAYAMADETIDNVIIPKTSPLVQNIVAQLQKLAPNVLNAAGVSNDKLVADIQAAFARLQSGSVPTHVVPDVPVATSPVVAGSLPPSAPTTPA